MRSMSSQAALAAACFSLLSLTGQLCAQTPLGGSLSGTLAAGVYHTTGSISVAAGQTLTLPAGVIIKFHSSGDEFTVDGTLITNGTAANPVIFTGIADDSAGGDTNGNGPSSAGPTAWRGIVFTSGSSASVLNYADVRYGGSGFVSNIHCSNANPTLSHCVIRDNYTHGMNLGTNSFPHVSNCTFTGNGGYAIEGVDIAALPGFVNNTASGNYGNFARTTSATVTGNLTIPVAAMISGAVCFDSSIVVNQGATLTFAPGVVCKMNNSGIELTVNGTLITNGTPANPVIFTGLADDSAGGDTNGNGPSSAGPTAWRGIVFTPTSSNCTLNYADVRYGGSGFVSNVHCNAANPTLNHCILRNNYTHGMNLSNNSFPSVNNCTFTNNGGYAIEGVAIAALPGLVNNTASGNSGNFARTTSATVTGNLTIPVAAMISGAVCFDTSIVVNQGATLTFAPGVVCKLMNSGIEITVNGSLVTNGNAGNPVVFTGLADDSAGGDTNGNGPSSAGATAWRGIVFNSTSSNCVLNYADVRYGGSGFVSNIHCNSASPTLSHCVIRNNYTHGMNLNNNSFPTVSDCTFTTNGGRAVANASLAAVPGFTNNTASGNVGNHIQVVSGSVTGYLRIGSQSQISGALILTTGVQVAVGGDLVLEQGVVFKFESASEVVVDGGMHLLGTGYEPVVFTAANDDSIGGDTNSNGPTSGGSAAWRGVTIHAGAIAYLENTLIRYPGSGFVPGLTSSSSNTTLHSVRVDSAYDTGFELQALAGSPTNLIAWHCNTGIHLASDSFTVAHATCTANNVGMRRENAWSGSVVNSIVYGNSSNFGNFGAGAQVDHSDGGFAGSNGNLSVDPLFVDAINGDLHLTSGSPCLDVADLAQALLTRKDHDENSRVLDHSLTGILAPDMGAFELPAWDMVVGGQARPGATVTFTVTGPVGQSFIAMGLNDGTTPFYPFGILLCGVPGSTLALLYPSAIPVGYPIPLPLVNDAQLIGIAVGIETLTLSAANPSLGNFTRLHRMLIRP